MPRPPPRPLCLPELVSNPQTRADFVLANPPRYGPPSSRSSLFSDSPYPRAPSSPTSTNDADSHRASGATLFSLNSPVTPASSRTSLSVHNISWNGDSSRSSVIGDGLLSMPGDSSEGKTWNFGKLSLGGGTPAVGQKPRTSWSSAFVSTKSWFGSATTAGPVEAIPSASSSKEIKCVYYYGLVGIGNNIPRLQTITEYDCSLSLSTIDVEPPHFLPLSVDIRRPHPLLAHI